MKLKASSK